MQSGQEGGNQQEQDPQQVFDEQIVDLAHHPHATMGVDYRLGPHIIELDLTHCGLRKIENLKHLKHLRVLMLRQNLLTKVENLEDNTELEHLDLYDNQLKNSSIDVQLFNKYLSKSLKHLDLSFNSLTKCVVGLQLPLLEELYYVNNKIKRIDENSFDGLPSLKLLELGSNRIREIKNLDSLTSLRQLWLGTNKITQIKNLDKLTNLEKLSIQCNRLTKIEGLSSLKNLTELYLSENGIEKIENLEELVNLRILDLANNRISKLENIEHLQQLEEFWINDNQLNSFEELNLLAKLPHLDAVFLQRNRIESDPQYRRKVVLILPHITQLDGFPIMKNSLLLNS